MTRAEAGVARILFAYFAFVGAASPYLSLYLAAAGFSAQAVGLLMTMPQVIRIVAPPFWGGLADRIADRALLLRASAAAALVLALILAQAGGQGWLIVAALGLMHFALAAQSPVSEALTVSIAAGDAGRYGRMRAWGSVGFIVAVTVLGAILDRFGAITLPGWLAVLAALLLAATFRLPAAAAAPRAAPAGQVAPRWREPAVVAFLASAALMVFAHAPLYAYFSLYLELHGYSKTAIGLLWALGVLVEIVVFRIQRPLFQRFPALRLIGASLVVAAVRFGLLAGSEGWLPVILLTQLLHSVTFGIHHSACMAMMHRWFPPAAQARAQGIFSTVVYGIGGTAGGLAASGAWSVGSGEAAFAMAAVASVAGFAAIAVCARLQYARTPSTL